MEGGCGSPFIHATRRTPHGASRLVQAMSAWLVWKPDVLRPGINRDARVYGHTTTAMHKLSTPRIPACMSMDGAPFFPARLSFSSPLLSSRQMHPKMTVPSPLHHTRMSMYGPWRLFVFHFWVVSLFLPSFSSSGTTSFQARAKATTAWQYHHTLIIVEYHSHHSLSL